MTPVTDTLQSPIHPADIITREQRECFYALVQSTGEGCWEWAGEPDYHGYGIFSIGTGYEKRPMPASRIAWGLANPEVDMAGMYVCHSCDNPPCCRLSHLFLGTPLENTIDRLRKKRGKTKLTEDDVYKIRASKKPRSVLAKHFGVSESTVLSIQRRYIWAWLEENDLEALFGDN